MPSNRSRKLFGSPVLLQDWDRVADEGAAKYWELFLDLLLVAAASALADQFKEDRDFVNFVLYFLILVNSWFLYTHHVATRFEDDSLAFSFLLFVYFYGFGISIVNVGDADKFAAGSLLQRFCVLVMLASVAFHIPRARYSCAFLAIITSVTMVALLVALVTGSETVATAGLWIAALFEVFTEWLLVCTTDIRRFTPVNIEQTKDRMGALVLIMLGETALSVTLTYREMDKNDIVGDRKSRYYLVLGLAFLLIFMVCLLYFHMSPEPANHAIRRSKYRATAWLQSHKILGVALLAVGTSVKFIVESVIVEDEHDLFVDKLLTLGIGTTLVIMVFMRYLHFGRQSEFHIGEKTLVWGLYPDLDWIGNVWWATFVIACALPFIGCVTGVMAHNPLTSLAVNAALLLVLTLLETFYASTIQNAVDARISSSDGERQPLVEDAQLRV